MKGNGARARPPEPSRCLSRAADTPRLCPPERAPRRAPCSWGLPPRVLTSSATKPAQGPAPSGTFRSGLRPGYCSQKSGGGQREADAGAGLAGGCASPLRPARSPQAEWAPSLTPTHRQGLPSSWDVCLSRATGWTPDQPESETVCVDLAFVFCFHLEEKEGLVCGEVKAGPLGSGKVSRRVAHATWLLH